MAAPASGKKLVMRMGPWGVPQRTPRNIISARQKFINDPETKKPLEALLSSAYGKPVELNFTKLNHSHLDAGIHAAVTTQLLRDRTNNTASMFREMVTRLPLPELESEVPSKSELMATMVRQLKRKPGLRGVGMRRTNVSSVMDELKLKRVSGIKMTLSGRLGKRAVAARVYPEYRIAGLTMRNEGVMMRGTHPLHKQTAFRTWTRRVGAYGVKVTLGHR